MKIVLLILFLAAVTTVKSSTSSRGKSTGKPISRQFLSLCFSTHGPSNRPIGADCECGNQCNSLRCRDGTCTCLLNAHCPHGYTCVKKLFKPNRCSSVSRALGAKCSRDRECASDECQGGKCVCSDDGDCPTGQKCKRKLFKSNKCVTGDGGTAKLGESCSKNGKCASGKCQKKQCVCNDNGDCPDGYICRKPLFSKNKCSRSGRPVGAKCRKKKQCKSKKCEGKECVCRVDNDCPFGQSCKKKLFKKNKCK